jgi:signal transduction histidine kinase
MQQVFLNLVNNALDAMEKTGGIITLALNNQATISSSP